MFQNEDKPQSRALPNRGLQKRWSQPICKIYQDEKCGLDARRTCYQNEKNQRWEVKIEGKWIIHVLLEYDKGTSLNVLRATTSLPALSSSGCACAHDPFYGTFGPD